jgi:glutamate N-acetyltransferase / amino-acid N-acetyltransferase
MPGENQMTEVQATISGVAGFKVAGTHCGLKKDGQLDFALIVSDRPCTAAGVFTTNQVKAAPVLIGMQRLASFADSIQAVAINTGSANACTGRKGLQDAQVTATWVAEALDCCSDCVLVMSTGVIGTHLPLDKIKQGVVTTSGALGHDWEAAAKAIMTTDTRHKTASITVTTASGKNYAIAGMCKGSGMIAPNMATMLSVVTTDVTLTVPQTQTTLQTAVEKSFNCIVVDGDMSTNDTVLLMANGASEVELSTKEDLAQFQTALDAVCKKLAQDIVRDGEGVTKFVTINIEGAPDRESAKKIGNAIATSPLVKTAFYGNDANWGRIICAAGYAGVQLNPDDMRLWIAPGEDMDNALELFAKGMPTEYSEEEATAIVENPSVSIRLDCGQGGEDTVVVWTCDLSHDYITINGDYRT